MGTDFSLLGQFFVITLLMNLAISQPIDGSDPGVDSRKSIPSVDLNKGYFQLSHTFSACPTHRSSAMEKVEIEDHVHPGHIGDNEVQTSITSTLRSRRSPKYPPQPKPSVELQTIMSGNWHGMDPQSLLKLLNTLATSKETLPDDFYGYDDPYDEDPIDLVYSGRNKPLVIGPTTSSSNRGIGAPTHSSLRGVPPLAEPISIMSSNHVRDDDEAQPLQKHRVTKNKKLFPFTNTVIKRSSFNQLGNRDLVQLPNGGIAFSPHGIHVFRYHQPIPINVDEERTLVRRPVL